MFKKYKTLAVFTYPDANTRRSLVELKSLCEPELLCVHYARPEAELRHATLVKQPHSQHFKLAVITVEPAVQRFSRESEAFGSSGYFVVLLTHFTDCEALHSLWMLQPK